MKASGRKNADEVLALGLAAGKTVQAAARAAKVSESTAARRMKDPAFLARVSDLRGEMVGRAVGHLADAMTAAAATLRKLLSCSALNVRLGAARSLIELGVRIREATELEERVKALESVTRREGRDDDATPASRTTGEGEAAA